MTGDLIVALCYDMGGGVGPTRSVDPGGANVPIWRRAKDEVDGELVALVAFLRVGAALCI